MRIYNSHNFFGYFLFLLVGVLTLLFMAYIISAIEYRVLAIPIYTVLNSVLNPQFAFILLFYMFVFPKLHGYATTNEGIGTARATKSGWQFVAYTKWEDIVGIEYKRTVFFGTKFLLIRSSKRTLNKKKVIYINSTQREFKEIVRMVIENTNLPAQ